MKSDPAIQNPCHKEAYPENFINLEQSQAKWIHHLATLSKGGHDIFTLTCN